MVVAYLTCVKFDGYGSRTNTSQSEIEGMIDLLVAGVRSIILNRTFTQTSSMESSDPEFKR